jgi:hypothetical protein
MDFPGVRWRGHWVAPDVPVFMIDPTSVGSDLPPGDFSRAQFRRVLVPVELLEYAEMADWLGRCAPLDCGPFMLLATAGYQAMDNRQAIKALPRP